MNKTIHANAHHLAHDLAAIFPMMDDETRSSTIESMKAHGFDPKKAIVLFNGEVLDGRNRYSCALDAKVEPVFREFDEAKEGAPIDFVIRENLNRRHMSPSQRAAAAVALLPFIESARLKAAEDKATPAAEPVADGQLAATESPASPPPANSEQGSGTLPEKLAAMPGRSADKAAAALQVSPTQVKQAKKLKTLAPDLFDEVEAGSLSINAAMAKLNERQAADKGKKVAEKERGERKKALEDIAKNYGNDHAITAAAKAKKILKKHADLLSFAGMSDTEGKRLFPLLLQGWDVTKAQSYLGGKLLPESSISDLINTAIASENDPFELKILGHYITVTKAEG